jgi:hypothetical protein
MAVKKQKKTATSAPEGGEGGDAPMSKADAFDQAKAMGSVEVGKYEAVVDEFVLQKPDEKGESARIKYKIASEGDAQGQTVTQWYKLFNADETPAKGLEFLKKDLAVLGYDDVKYRDLEGVFEEIADAHTGVVITVKHNDNFVNCYLQGLCEDSDIIEAFLEKFPY